MKLNTHNIATWWFAVDTPIRQYKISMNPALQWACEQVNKDFDPPSGATTPATYRRSDKIAFAKAVQELLQSVADRSAEDLNQN